MYTHTRMSYCAQVTIQIVVVVMVSSAVCFKFVRSLTPCLVVLYLDEVPKLDDVLDLNSLLSTSRYVCAVQYHRGRQRCEELNLLHFYDYSCAFTNL